MTNANAPDKMVRTRVKPDMYKRFKAAAVINGLAVQDALAVAMALYVSTVEEQRKTERTAA